MRFSFLFLPMILACNPDPGPGDGPTTGTPTGTDTTDQTAPTVLSTTPADGATEVAPSVVIDVVFSEALDPASAGEAALSVTAGGDAVAGQVSLQGDDTLRFTPSADLPYLAELAVEVATSVTDLAGNALEAPYSFGFETAWDPGYANVVYFQYGSPDDQAIRADLGATAPTTVSESVLFGDGSRLDGLWVSPLGTQVAYKVGDYNVDYELRIGPLSGLEAPATVAITGSVDDVRWSPDGSQLAVTTTDRVLHLVAADGSTVTAVSDPSHEVRNFFDWSPDGSQLAWLDDLTGALHVLAVGGASQELAQGVEDFDGEEPKFSPDSTRIAYNVAGDALFVADLASGSSTQLTPANPWGVWDFSWRGDDDLLWRGCDDSCTTQTLWKVPAAGGASTPILDGKAQGYSWRVSPDGAHVAYIRADAYAIYVAQVDAAAPSPSTDWQVSTPGAVDIQGNFGDWERPVWSPDGQHLLYRENILNSDPCQLHIVEADGSNRTQLSQLVAYGDEVSPWGYTFSPDGQRVVYGIYIQSERDSRRQIRSVALDGSDPVQVNVDPATDAAWFQVRDGQGVSRPQFVYDYWY